MKYGLSDIELNKLREFYARYEDIEEVILYGSRAKGNHKPFSDVDISLVGANLTRSRLNQIAFAIDDLLLPYQFDLSIFHKLRIWNWLIIFGESEYLFFVKIVLSLLRERSCKPTR